MMFKSRGEGGNVPRQSKMFKCMGGGGAMYLDKGTLYDV